MNSNELVASQASEKPLRDVTQRQVFAFLGAVTRLSYPCTIHNDGKSHPYSKIWKLMDSKQLEDVQHPGHP